MDRKTWRQQVIEPALDPELPIVDAHHHLWAAAPVPAYEPYPPEEILTDIASAGHRVVATVYMDSQVNYRLHGPDHLRSVGETEYADTVAEQCLREGLPYICAGVVPQADLLLGERVGEVLDAHSAASARFRGIRHMTAFDPEITPGRGARQVDLMMRPEFRKGFAELVKRGLTFDAWMFHPQLPQLVDLAHEFPEARIVLDHTGGPLRIGRYAHRLKESFAQWRAAMAAVAAVPNVSLKIGGLNMKFTAMDATEELQPNTSEKSAQLQREHVLTAIDLFSPARCMFESNFPADMLATSYGLLWNSFKRMTEGFTPDERREMFAGTAIRTYQLDGVNLEGKVPLVKSCGP